MKKQETQPSSNPESRVASTDEVNRALDALSERELVALKRYAAWRVGRVFVAAGGRTDEDLLHDAIVLALTGDRTWDPSRADFKRFLRGAMWSISSGWAEMYRTQKTFLAEDLVAETEEGAKIDPTAQIPSKDPTPEEIAHAEQLKRMFDEMLGEDPLRREVLEAKMAGFSGAEIQEMLGITKQQYDAARQAIHRLGVKLVGNLGSYEWKRE